MTVEYTGAALLNTIRAVDGDGNELESTSGTVITFFSVGYPNVPFAGGEVTITANFLLLLPTNITINTTCSDPIFQGKEYSNGDFVILAGESVAGGTLCCSPSELDNDPPDFVTFPDDIDLTLASNECTKVVNWTLPTASDNCGVVVITTDSEFQPGDSFGPGDHFIEYTATDEHGNTRTDDLRIRIRDETDPLILDCPGDITVEASSVIGECGASVSWQDPSFEDCSATTVTRSHAPGATFSVGTTVVTYTFEDAEANTASCTFTVEVQDITAPVFTTCPIEIVRPADDLCSATATWTLPSAEDNCGIQSIVSTSGHTPGQIFPFGTTTVTYTATDINGNTALCSFDVVVDDQTAPVFSNCPADVELVSNPLSCGQVHTWANPSVSDNCSIGFDVLRTHNSGSTFPVGTTTVTYTATDDDGNVSTCSFDVTVVDETPPVITGCPGNITVPSSTLSCDVPVLWTPPVATDNCAVQSFTSTHAPSDVFPVGTTTVTYTATDIHGNVSTCEFDITVEDTTPPVISDCPVDITISSNPLSCDAVVSWEGPDATDNCDVATFVSDHDPGNVFPVGTTIVTYTATDIHGNISTCVFNVTVEDKTPPVITGCPENIVVDSNPLTCNVAVSWEAPEATDNCSVATFVSNFNPGDVFPVGTTQVIYTATDIHGNIAECAFDVTVEDVTPPMIDGCPSDITIASSGTSCDVQVIWDEPEATDNCGVATFVSSMPSGSTFPVGTTVVTYTATDVNGNISTCTFTVEVADETPPVITDCPADITIPSNSSSCGAAVNWVAPQASDNCAIQSFTSTHSPNTVFPVGTTIVTYTATDIHGNVSTCEFDITVEDTTPPVISDCPVDITISSNPLSCDAVVSWEGPDATDNCGVAAFVSDHDAGDVFPVGTTTVTYTATDIHNNVSTCTFNVTVEDNTPPVITNCPENISIPSDPSTCNISVIWQAPEATDNCSVATFVSNFNPGDVFPVGTTQVIYTATDIHGNIAECSFDITVQDVTPPVITGCPADITIASAAASCDVQVFWDEPEATDNCGIATFAGSRASGDLFAVGTTVVTYTATDVNGNISTCTFTVEVADETPPVITDCPVDITVSSDALSCDVAVDWIEPQTSDNCAIATFTSTHQPDDIFDIGTTAVTYTATDVHGNISTCTFNVTVQDATPPTIVSTPDNIEVASVPTGCYAAAIWGEPQVTDNCGGTITLTSDYESGHQFALGETVVTYTATDNVGNQSTSTFTVTVIDATPPVLSGIPADITLVADANCQAVANWPSPTAADQCDSDPELSGTFNSGALFPLGVTTVVYTAADDAGNVVTDSFTVTVLDNTSPGISGVPSDIIVIADETGKALANWAPPTVSDNCDDSPNLTSDFTSGSIFDYGVTTVTYTTADDAANSATETFTVTVQDITPPQIIDLPEDITEYADHTGVAVVTWPDPAASDNCDDAPALVADHPPGSTFPFGETIVSYTASDESDNAIIGTFAVQVVDTIAPEIVGMPADITVISDATGTAVATWILPTVTDNVDSEPELTSDYPSGYVFPYGVTVVTYTARDNSNNISTGTFPVTVGDDLPPSITNVPLDINVFADIAGQAIATWDSPVVIDNCDSNPQLTSTHASGSVFSCGTTTVVFTAIDETNNSSTASFSVNVLDNINPVITGCPANLTVHASQSCEAVVTWTLPAAMDNCDDNVQLTGTSSPGDSFPLGETVVSYTATDDTGNTAICSFTVTVVDESAPVIVGCQHGVIIEVVADGSCDATVSWTPPTISDNCAATLTSSHNPGDVFPIGKTEVIYTATDVSGNFSTCKFNIMVKDKTAPVISACPSDMTAVADASCGAVVTWIPPVMADNCGGQLTSSHNPGETFPVGLTEVTYTATDTSENTSTCSFTITVVDDSAPVITGCIFEDIVLTASGSCLAIATWAVPVATDNCEGLIFTSTHSPGDEFPLGATEVIYTATDPSGNTSTCSFNVVVKDESAPEFLSCPQDITVRTNTSCQATVEWNEPDVLECSPYTMIKSHSSGDTFPIGATAVTYTATDEHGNVSSCKFTVTVVDKMAPVFANCPAEISVVAGEGCRSPVEWVDPAVSDNCELASLTRSHNPGDIFERGSTEVTYTATDIYGNVSTCTFVISVRNETAPTVTGCPVDIGIRTGESGVAEATWTPPIFATTCGEVSVSSTHLPGDTFGLGTTEVLYTATDEDGNTAICSFNVVVSYDEVLFDIVPVITPDGDGINDRWVVGNIDKFSENKVVIVDRWGSVIFSGAGYDNEQVVWKGENSSGSVVPTGTYFYTISVRIGPVLKQKTGFIELIQ